MTIITVKSEQERREKRRTANRKSARKSRFRELIMLTELQNSVSQLSKTNQRLRQENEEFLEKMETLRALMIGKRQQSQTVLEAPMSSSEVQVSPLMSPPRPVSPASSFGDNTSLPSYGQVPLLPSLQENIATLKKLQEPLNPMHRMAPSHLLGGGSLREFFQFGGQNQLANLQLLLNNAH